jgi:rhodanese-related sulfurtransferase
MNLWGLFRHPDGLSDLDPDELTRRLGDQPVVIDVRTAGEYAGGHI